MFNDFNNIFQYSISVSDVLINLVVALICGIIISFFYRKTYKGPGYLVSFVNSLVILSMVTAVVIMIIGNNLARAFGLVGAMSIIRFRTAVKETQDIIFIFFALCIGMAAGVGLHSLAILGTLFVGAVALILSKSNISAPSKRDFLLQFTFQTNNGHDDSQYENVLSEHCKRIKLINAKTLGNGDIMELSYHVGFRDNSKSPELLKALNGINGINQVNLFFDEEYF